MEGDDHDQEHGVAGKGGVPTTPRWNPTKEQISILEGYYREGVKTPNAEQIEEITTRLKAFGEIECKNVFYWFQNHKARIRQKLKQDNFPIFNRFLLPPNPHVICSPYYMPQSNFGFYPKIQIQDGIKKRPRIERNVKISKLELGAGYATVAHFSNGQLKESSKNQETLDLFPVHPTGILEGRQSYSNSDLSSSSSNCSDKYLFI